MKIAIIYLLIKQNLTERDCDVYKRNWDEIKF